MSDLFESVSKDREEIERLFCLVEDMRRTRIKLKNELSDFVESAKLNNDNQTAFPKVQEAISDWNKLVEEADLAWKEEILTAPCDAALKL